MNNNDLYSTYLDRINSFAKVFDEMVITDMSLSIEEKKALRLVDNEYNEIIKEILNQYNPSSKYDVRQDLINKMLAIFILNIKKLEYAFDAGVQTAEEMYGKTNS